MRKKQNGGWKLSDTDWFYFSFYNPSCFFYDPSWSKSNFILFLFFYSIRVGPSQSELIRPGLAVRVDRAGFCTCLLTRTHWFWTGLMIFHNMSPRTHHNYFVTITLYIDCKLTSCSARKKLLYKGTYRGIFVRTVIKGLDPKHLLELSLL